VPGPIGGGAQKPTIWRRISPVRGYPDGQIDIWRVAQLMLKRYGDDAELESAKRADELAETGGLEGAAVWRRVVGADIQLANATPGSGQPIVLLADHQTTGGYPKIATVISADLPAVGRRRPGDLIRFAAVTVEAAEALYRAEERRLAELVAAFEPVPSRSAVDLASLYGSNLISGVVSGIE